MTQQVNKQGMDWHGTRTPAVVEKSMMVGNMKMLLQDPSIVLNGYIMLHTSLYVWTISGPIVLCIRWGWTQVILRLLLVNPRAWTGWASTSTSLFFKQPSPRQQVPDEDIYWDQNGPTSDKQEI